MCLMQMLVSKYPESQMRCSESAGFGGRRGQRPDGRRSPGDESCSLVFCQPFSSCKAALAIFFLIGHRNLQSKFQS